MYLPISVCVMCALTDYVRYVYIYTLIYTLALQDLTEIRMYICPNYQVLALMFLCII